MGLFARVLRPGQLCLVEGWRGELRNGQGDFGLVCRQGAACQHRQHHALAVEACRLSCFFVRLRQRERFTSGAEPSEEEGARKNVQHGYEQTDVLR